MQVHFPGCLPVSHPGNSQVAAQPSLNWNSDSLNYIDSDSVQKAIMSFRPNSAAGPDGIKPLVLRQLGPILIDRLVFLFRAFIILGYTPQAFCVAKVIFIPKPGRRDYSAPKSYRPISLSSCLFKTCEKVVLHHLEQTSLASNPCLLYTSDAADE